MRRGGCSAVPSAAMTLARNLAQAERICRGIHRRVPWRLRTLLTEYEMPWPADSGTRRRSGRARVLLAWNRSYAAVIQDVLLQTFPLQRRDPSLR